eukprot:XP_011682484.1 PREDICTED: uncharacterized protein LOC105446846 isoform X1 [Strongylocentrotus purpuratus]
MTVTESVLQVERQDRRTTIHDAQQQTMNTLVKPTTTTKQSTTAPMTLSMSPKKDTVRGRSSPSKTPVLLADGRIVKKELKGIMVEEKKNPKEAERYEYGPEHNKYYGAKLVNFKKKLAAIQSPLTAPNYARTMRNRMRNLYRRILADYPNGEHLFDMENEPGKCLVTKKYEPHEQVDDDDEKCDVSVDGAARARTGKHRNKGINIPTKESGEIMKEAVFDNFMPGVPKTAPPLPGEDRSLPIATVAVTDRLQSSGSRRRTSIKTKATTVKQPPTPVISCEHQSDKNMSLTSTNPPCNDEETPDAMAKATTSRKMLSIRNTVPRSKLKKSPPPYYAPSEQRSNVGHSSEKALKTSNNLYSHLQSSLPVLKKVAV